MIQLGDSPVSVPGLQDASTGALSNGTVYVATVQNGTLQPALVAGKKAILITAGSPRLELATTQTYNGTPGGPGTYLAEEDFYALGDRNAPELRLYRRRDTWGKVFSLAGLLVWAPAILGLITAGVGLFFLLAAQSPTSATAVAQRAQTVIAWVTEPMDDALADGDQLALANARQEVVRRRQVATRCLRQLQGETVPAASIPDVECKPAKVDTWRDKENQAAITVVVGALTALLGGIGTLGKFGFRKSPG